jgi:hypothetical protein
MKAAGKGEGRITRAARASRYRTKRLFTAASASVLEWNRMIDNCPARAGPIYASLPDGTCIYIYIYIYIYTDTHTRVAGRMCSSVAGWMFTDLVNGAFEQCADFKDRTMYTSAETR